MNISNKSKNNKHKIMMMAVVFYSLCLGFYFITTATAGVSESGVKCRVEIDRAILPAGGNQKAVIKVTLDAPPPPQKSKRPAVNLAIVLDRSGSMAGGKLERAKDAAIEALRHLGPMDMFSVVVYDHNVSTVISAQHAKNIEWIEGRIRQIQSGGNTALFAGVSQGASEVRKNIEGNYVHRIILLSDGLANVGPSSPEDLGRLGVALIKEGMSVTTIGVGTDYNEDLMTHLSQNSDGNTYFVESSRDLPRIFTAELGDVLSIVAKKVRVIIECPDGVKPLNIIGREGRIRGKMVEFSLNQLYGSQEKYALIEVEIPGGKSGEKKDIAYVNVAYENPFTQKKETSSALAYARFSKDRVKVKKSANISVKREYNLNLNALSQEKAISLSDKGKKKEAVSELKKSAQKLRQVGRQHNDEDLLKRAEEMEVQANQIEKEGMTKKYRKVLRTDSYQMKNQQMSK